MKSKGARGELLKHQLLIRYAGFKSAPQKSWSCAKEGRKGTEEGLRASLEVLLEIEKNAPLTGRLEVQFEASKHIHAGGPWRRGGASARERDLTRNWSYRLLQMLGVVLRPHTSPVRCVSGGESACAHGHVD
jgi:hypothetical protein